MHQYEIELRGPLSLRQKNKLLKFLNKFGRKIKEYKRIQWCFKDSWEKNLDLRVKVTNNDVKLSLKLGNPSKPHRKEISLHLRKNDLKKAFDFVKHLGYRKGFKAWRNADIFEYKQIEWAIVEVPDHSYYFEAEKLVRNKKEGQMAEDEIKKVAYELGLKVFSPKETLDYIGKLDREANKFFKL